MKIVQTIPWYYPAYGFGGPQNKLRFVIRQLVNIGYKNITVISTNALSPDKYKSSLPESSIIDDINVIRMKNLFKIGSYSITNLFGKILNDLDPNIIHCRLDRTFITDYSIIWAYKKNIPTILEPNGATPYDICNNIGKRLHDLITLKSSYKLSSVILAESNNEREQIIKFGIPSEKIFVNSAGVDTVFFSNGLKERFCTFIGLKNNSNNKHILFVGRFNLI